MKKITIRIMSLILVITMLIPQISVFATSVDKVEDIEVILKDEFTNEFMEISQADGSYMYFHDADSYTVAINIYQSGLVEIVKYDKTSNSINQTFTNTQTLIGNTTPALLSSTKLYVTLENMIDNGKIVLENNMDDELDNATNSPLATDTDIAKMIDDALIAEFGTAYSERYRASYRYQGYTGYLYESRSFERYKHYSWFLNAGSTLGVVATLMAIPQSVVLKIMTFVGTAATGYSLYQDITSNRYVANVHNNKVVKVVDIYPYRAGRTEYGYCYVGDKNAAYVSRNKVSVDSDFDDNISLIKTAITNYINYH